jgi:hypothetical protein
MRHIAESNDVKIDISKLVRKKLINHALDGTRPFHSSLTVTNAPFITLAHPYLLQSQHLKHISSHLKCIKD